MQDRGGAPRSPVPGGEPVGAGGPGWAGRPCLGPRGLGRSCGGHGCRAVPGRDGARSAGVSERARRFVSAGGEAPGAERVYAVSPGSAAGSFPGGVRPASGRSGKRGRAPSGQQPCDAARQRRLVQARGLETGAEGRGGEGRDLKQAGMQTGGEAGPAVQMGVRWPGPAERAGPGPAGGCRNDGGLGRGRKELGCGGGRLHLGRKLPRAGGGLGLYPELASHRQQGVPEAGLSAGEPRRTALLPCLRTCCGSPLQPGVLCVVGTNTRLTALLIEEMTVRRAISNLLHPRRCLGTPQGQGPLELTSGGAPSPKLGTETEE